MSLNQQELRQQARQAFDRDLPRLLAECPGQWVAYHGDRRVGCALHTGEIYKACARQGLSHDQVLIFEIIPPDEEMMFGPMAFD
jgi:hypothetical protein